MQVIFETRNPECTGLREAAVARVQFALRRLVRQVPRATVRLSDLNGPRGGMDKRCQVSLDTGGGGVVISAVAADWRRAINNALARAVQALTRQWQRERRHGRDSPRRAAPGLLPAPARHAE